MTFGDLNNDLIKKIDRNTSVMISDELSNALFRFSLRCLGSEIAVFFSNTPQYVVENADRQQGARQLFEGHQCGMASY